MTKYTGYLENVLVGLHGMTLSVRMRPEGNPHAQSREDTLHISSGKTKYTSIFLLAASPLAPVTFEREKGLRIKNLTVDGHAIFSVPAQKAKV